MNDTRTVFFSDREKMDAFTSKVPQLWVERLNERLQGSGWLTEADIDTFIYYFLYLGENSLFVFEDKEIQSAFTKFNKRAKSLDKYIDENFSYFKSVPKRQNSEAFERFELYPLHRRSNDSAKRDFYYNRLGKLSELTLSFGRAYYQLVRTGMRVIGKSSTTQTIPSQTNTSRIVGSTFVSESGYTIDLTNQEKKLLQMLLSKEKQDSPDAHEYGLVRKVELEKVFGSKKSFPEVRRRLLKKNPERRPRIIDIIKDYERDGKKQLSGFRLIVRKTKGPQNLSNTKVS